MEFAEVQDRVYFPIEFPQPIQEIIKKIQDMSRTLRRKVRPILNFRKFDECQES